MRHPENISCFCESETSLSASQKRPLRQNPNERFRDRVITFGSIARHNRCDVYCGARETVGESSVSSGCWGEDSDHKNGWARRTPTYVAPIRFFRKPSDSIHCILAITLNSRRRAAINKSDCSGFRSLRIENQDTTSRRYPACRETSLPDAHRSQHSGPGGSGS